MAGRVWTRSLIRRYSMKRLLIALMMVATVAVAALAERTTLNFLYYIDATQAGYAEDQAFWQKFKDANPDIDLQMEILFSQPYHQKLGSYVAAGQLPDVAYMWPTSRDSSKLLHDNKLMADLRKVLGPEFLGVFNAAALDPKQQSSGYVAELPQSFTYTSVLYVNKKLLADNGIALPQTYADLKKMVLKLRAKNVQTLILPNFDQWPAQSCLFSTMVGRYLGDAWVDKVKAGKVKFTDKDFVNVLNQYKQLYDDGIINVTNVQLGYGEGPAMFASGRASMYVDGDWRVGAYVTDRSTGKALIDPKAQEGDFEIVNFPAFPGEKFPGATSAIAGCGLGINKALSGAKLAAAKKLVEWYYGKEFQTMKWETGAFVPSRGDVSSSKLEPLSMKLPKFYAANAKVCYVLDGQLDPSVFNVLNAGLQSIPLGAETSQQVAKKMQDAQDKLLKK
jgi:raffinose/stachyose/melibiose transport system substrate-binding protein